MGLLFSRIAITGLSRICRLAIYMQMPVLNYQGIDETDSIKRICNCTERKCNCGKNQIYAVQRPVCDKPASHQNCKTVGPGSCGLTNGYSKQASHLRPKVYHAR